MGAIVSIMAIAHDDRDHDRYVFTRVIRCPACGHDGYKVYGHRRVPGEPKAQYARCKAAGCDHRFLIVFEDTIQQR